MASSLFDKARSTVKDLLKTNNTRAEDNDYEDDEYEEYVEENTPRKNAEKQKAEQKNTAGKKNDGRSFIDNSYADDFYKSTYTGASTGMGTNQASYFATNNSVPKQEFKTSFTDGADKSKGYQFAAQNSKTNVYEMKNAAGTKRKFTFSLIKFEKIEDTVAVADQMLSGDTVTVINLHDVPENVARRVIDFLDGVRYTCNARIELIADLTYVIIPETVELAGDFCSQVDTNGLTF